MTLQELGFHKSAGAQKDFYMAMKPHILGRLNARNLQDIRSLKQFGERAEKEMAPLLDMPIHAANAENKRGPFALLLREETPLMGKTQNNLNDQLQKQTYKRERAMRYVNRQGGTDKLRKKMLSYQTGLNRKESLIRGLKEQARHERIMRYLRTAPPDENLDRFLGLDK